MNGRWYVIICAIGLILLFSVGRCDKVGAEDAILYPDSYALTENEVPEGFILFPFESRRDFFTGTGMTGNPGIINNRDLYEHLYSNADASKMKNVYISLYIKNDTFNKEAVHVDFIEFSITVIEYNSKAVLDEEMKKIKLTQAGLIEQGKVIFYLKHENHLIITATLSKELRKTLEDVSGRVKLRLGLKEI